MPLRRSSSSVSVRSSRWKSEAEVQRKIEAERERRARRDAERDEIRARRKAAALARREKDQGGLGPCTYGMPKDAPVKAFSIGVRRAPLREQAHETPAPAAYEPETADNVVRPKSPTQSMARARREAPQGLYAGQGVSAPSMSTPGPGHYKIEQCAARSMVDMARASGRGPAALGKHAGKGKPRAREENEEEESDEEGRGRVVEADEARSARGEDALGPGCYEVERAMEAVLPRTPQANLPRADRDAFRKQYLGAGQQEALGASRSNEGTPGFEYSIAGSTMQHPLWRAPSHSIAGRVGTLKVLRPAVRVPRKRKPAPKPAGKYDWLDIDLERKKQQAAQRAALAAMPHNAGRAIAPSSPSYSFARNGAAKPGQPQGQDTPGPVYVLPGTIGGADSLRRGPTIPKARRAPAGPTRAARPGRGPGPPPPGSQGLAPQRAPPGKQLHRCGGGGSAGEGRPSQAAWSRDLFDQLDPDDELVYY